MKRITVTGTLFLFVAMSSNYVSNAAAAGFAARAPIVVDAADKESIDSSISNGDIDGLRAVMLAQGYLPNDYLYGWYDGQTIMERAVAIARAVWRVNENSLRHAQRMGTPAKELSDAKVNYDNEFGKQFAIVAFLRSLQ